MKTSQQPVVDLNEMIDIFEYTRPSRSYINKEKSEIVHLMEGEDFSDIDEDLDDEFIPSHFIPLPDESDLNKYEIMEDFCHAVADAEIQDELLQVIRGRGAFGRFKTAIRCFKIEKEWFQFLHERLKEMAIEFCNVHNLKYRYRLTVADCKNGTV